VSQIFDLYQAIADDMDRRKFPITFAYGPLRQAHALGSYVLVIERDRDATDTIEPTTGVKTNPRRVANRGLGVKASIFVRSPLPGATIAEHEFDCEQMVDALIDAVLTSGRTATGAAWVEFGEARYMKPAELDHLDGVETWPGVAYLLKWRIPRGVTRADFKGAGLPTGAATATSNVIRVSRNASAGPPEEFPIGGT
jgi:hypothetical protein